MQNKKRKAKNTAETVNAKKNYLYINHSYGSFLLGDNIEKYIRIKHRTVKTDKNDYYKHCYYFYDYSIEAWCISSFIDVICCDKECWYKGMNLIGMTFDAFLQLLNSEPSQSQVIYVHKGYKKNGENQIVYDFDKEGLQVWVWLGKIVTILITKYDPEDEYSDPRK